MWKSPILALSSTTAKSQEIMSSKPPATAWPSTTAIVGFWRSNARANVRAESRAILTELFVVPRKSASSTLRSEPALKVLARPRMTTTCASGSSSARWSVSSSSLSIGGKNAFLTCGRLSQIVAIPPSTSYWMGSSDDVWSFVCSCTVMPLLRSRRLRKLNSDHTQHRSVDKAPGGNGEIAGEGGLPSAILN